jgi:Flp pilus assembly protein TadD
VGDLPAAYDRALAAHVAGDLASAEAGYRDAMAADPSHAESRYNLGLILQARKDLAEAVAVYTEAVALDPRHWAAFNNLGVTLNALGRRAEAVEAYEKALAIDPDNAATLTNLAEQRTAAGRYAEAEEKNHRALWLQPDLVEAHANLGFAYWGQGRNAQAIAAYRVALALDPQRALTRKNLAMVLLLTGRFEEGWRQYDWRFCADDYRMRPFTAPFWEGAALETKDGETGALLVWGDQGPGDDVWQATMATDLVARGLTVVWETDPRTTALFARSIPGVRFVARQIRRWRWATIEAHVPAGSLGQVLRPSAEMFPNRAGYLRADPARVAELRAKLSLTSGRVSSASRGRAPTRASAPRSRRASPIGAGCSRHPGCRFVDLQYGDTAQEREGLPLEHIDGLDLKNDLEGLAALIACCDVVITVSNTTAHLAAALGVPTWILVAAGGGRLWYWGDENTDTTLWYPGARIIRQRPGEPWPAAFERRRGKLRDLLEQETTRCRSPSATNASRKAARSSRCRQRHLRARRQRHLLGSARRRLATQIARADAGRRHLDRRHRGGLRDVPDHRPQHHPDRRRPDHCGVRRARRRRRAGHTAGAQLRSAVDGRARLGHQRPARRARQRPRRRQHRALRQAHARHLKCPQPSPASTP